MAEALELLKPGLYSPSGTAACPGHPSLTGGSCSCGHVFFPMQTYGCERCGRFGDALTPRQLSGRGRIMALATVHLHAGKGRIAPFTIVTIALEDGPVVRTLLDSESEADARPEEPVVTKLVPIVKDDGKTVLDLRFSLA